MSIEDVQSSHGLELEESDLNEDYEEILEPDQQSDLENLFTNIEDERVLEGSGEIENYDNLSSEEYIVMVIADFGSEDFGGRGIRAFDEALFSSLSVNEIKDYLPGKYGIDQIHDIESGTVRKALGALNEIYDNKVDRFKSTNKFRYSIELDQEELNLLYNELANYRKTA